MFTPGIALSRVVDDSDTRALLTTEQVRALLTLRVKSLRIEASLRAATAWSDQLLALYGAIFTYLQKRGISVVLTMMPTAVHGATQAHWNAAPDSLEFHTFSTAFAQAYQLLSRLPNLSAIEIWNEPNAWTTNNRGHLLGGTYLTPVNYAALIKEVLPLTPATLRLLLGPLFLHDSDPTASAYLAATAASLSLKGPYPPLGISIHPYFQAHQILDGNAFFTSVQSALNIAQHTFGSSLPCFITEFGWPAPTTAAEVEQSTNLTTAFAALAREPRLNEALWFLLDDAPQATPALFYGLRSQSGAHKEAYTTFLAYQRAHAPRPGGA